ncbi:MAG TPA: hypothetical protein VHW06_12730 [Streptosporangiaceae bacterium]|jgi:hypothetical protein|nr:hypothetical protein [Streptosporangiaceae bacterium]
MRATFNRFPKALTAVSVLLAALALVLSVQGCGTTASATTTVTGPNQARALKVFNAYVTAERVAVANRNTLLAQSLTSSAQYTVVSAQWSYGQPVTAVSYGKPTLYVPKLTTYPQWFMATVPESVKGKAIGTALMVFDKPDASANWLQYGSVMLTPGAPALHVAMKDGYATALRTTDKNLQFRPDEVGAIHATVVDDGPASAAAKVVAAGPLTTGLYQSNTAIAQQIGARGNYYSFELEGTSYPFFALATTDGGAIVMYTMSLNTSTTPVHASASNPITVPDQFKPLLPADQKPMTKLFDADYTQEYVAIDPPPVKPGGTAGQLQVVGTISVPTYAFGD